MAAAPKRKIESVFPLLGRTFRIDVGIPGHQSGDKRILHPARRQRQVTDSLITQIRLSDANPVTDPSRRDH